MAIYGWLQLVLFVALLFGLAKPVGLYILRVLDAEGKTFLDPLLRSLERLLYRFLGIDPQQEQTWQQYAFSLLVFSLVGCLFTYGVLRLQGILPLNPQHFGPMSPDLAFNTAASFTTNTDWQNYGGESTLSYFSQMVGLVFHNFVSAAAGIGVAAALMRGISRHEAKTVGNFWTDMVRTNLYLLLPLSLLFALFLVSQGVIQTFQPYVPVETLEQTAEGSSPSVQTLAQGPVASQAAIKMLGTNGGGFMNANAAHPYENPTPLSNFLQILAIFLIPSGLTYTLGRMTGNQRHGWAVWSAMALLFLAGLLVAWTAEIAGNPRLHALGVSASGGSMEGKEVRFGIFGSTLFAVVTTDASCGAVNAMHDSLTPLGGLVPLLNIQLGEVIFGGVGAGLYGMLVFVVLTVFLAGLMIGRTPEYLGKKIEAYDIKASVIAVLVPIFSILGFAGWAAVSGWGIAALANRGPHGLSEILYAFSSASGNNGSAFAGLNGNTPWYNMTLGAAMLAGRFFIIVPVLALAGNLARKKRVSDSQGSFPVSDGTFVLLLVATVIIVGALTFFPALSLGPVVEHFIMTGSDRLF
ncbi:potassium-transporting ATPase subunit KdpA [Desulforhabdus sp. TSK]|uniref:potassium-transporting ATPase subunit KdpA n=1 Tax=Desulforhabdus sp. TSK TaxID=2925014 RepID=UPI001FC89037|nr:potassium-transporting ATPase subunit KdpA [Desulforhabdus sp. TSK]GKT07153.1 potassium-transporting ATPase potassium-binding subunit [Desulforhabdus sp. TSK]